MKTTRPFPTPSAAITHRYRVEADGRQTVVELKRPDIFSDEAQAIARSEGARVLDVEEGRVVIVPLSVQ